MKISWLQVIRAFPGAKSAIEAFEQSGAMYSKTVWYNLIKAVVTVTAACGIYLGLSDEDIQTVSTAIVVAIPAVATIVDALVNIWLRFKTNKPLIEKVRDRLNAQ